MKITVNNLTKSYGNKIVFNDFSKEIEFNNIIALMGDSGEGKTTLLRIIAGLESYQKGQLVGVPETVSFMFQEDRLLPWFSAKENISCVSDEVLAEEYLEKVFLLEEKDTLVTQLSGGMKRRVALARALAYKSELVILDEPFKGLDEELKDKIISLILEESKNRPFLIVTHDKNDAIKLNAKIINV